MNEIQNIIKFSKQYIRNLLCELSKLGLVKGKRCCCGVSGLFSSLNAKELEVAQKQQLGLYALNNSFEKIVRKHPEIIDWGRKYLKVNSIDDLNKKIKEARKKIAESNLLPIFFLAQDKFVV
ncbi:MAG: hypothetical protein NTU58_00645 [Candidatus Nealsonbacteria bacterium]|nr:hypothetical protein [Candidatus Nealsonbacteria bacterium]